MEAIVAGENFLSVVYHVVVEVRSGNEHVTTLNLIMVERTALI